MKNKKYLVVFLILTSVTFATTSCNKIVDMLDKDSEYVSDTSFTPIFELNDGELIVLQLGEKWVEPGVKSCLAGEEDITSSVEIITPEELDGNTRGLFTVTYTAINKFGLKETIFRSVLITDGVDDLYDISGEYRLGFSKNYMNISKSEVDGFWLVENIYDGSYPTTALIADLGDKTYVIVRTYFFKKVSLIELYVQGTAMFDEATNKFYSYPETFQYGTNSPEQQNEFVWTRQ